MPPRIGPFRVVDLIGQGGMGVVYLGRRGRSFAAVKVINEEYARDRRFQERFRAEIDLAGRISSRYVASLVATPTRHEELYLATEYVVGENLRDYVRRTSRLSRPAVLVLAALLAQALDAIHEVGVCHRDVKPSNVMLTRGGVKLVDFGIGYAPDLGPAARGDGWMGAPAYMSPEALRGGRPTEAMDVYAWACTVVYAAVGKAPFDADWHRSKDASPRLTGVPAAIRPLVEHALHRDADRRPLARDLVRTLVGLQDFQGLVAGGPADALAPLATEHWPLPELRQVEPPARSWRWRMSWPRLTRDGVRGLLALLGISVVALASVLMIPVWSHRSGTSQIPTSDGSAAPGLAGPGGPTTPGGGKIPDGPPESSNPDASSPTVAQTWSAYLTGGGLTALEAESPAPGLTATAPGHGLHGACTPPAWTTGRADAIRCLDQSAQVHDPCWVPAVPTAEPIDSVLCGYPGERELTRIDLVTPLRRTDTPPAPPDHGPTARDPAPASIQLATGDLCLADSRSPDDGSAQVPTYTCPHGEAFGFPDRSGPVWTIQFRSTAAGATAPVALTRCYF
ncbi:MULTISPECIES: serine/threonine-protein kinase [unclassified Frankia]|nr:MULTISPECIES: serine/threonine-protein kinase [unclassified Frankia]